MTTAGNNLLKRTDSLSRRGIVLIQLLGPGSRTIKERLGKGIHLASLSKPNSHQWLY